MLDIEMNEHLGTVCALSFFEKGPVSQVEKQDGSCLLHATELTPSVWVVQAVQPVRLYCLNLIT